MMDLRQFFSSSATDPKKILKLVISISILLLVLWLFMVSKMDIAGSSGSADPAMQERADSLRESILPRTAENGAGPENRNRSSGLFMNAFTTFLILIAILAGVWFWMLKRSPVGRESEPVRELGTKVLGQGAQLKIVEMNDEVWVLGITPGSVNLLHRCPREEWREPVPDSGSGGKSFYNILRSKT